MHLKEESIYTNNQLLILDADCKKEQTIVLLNGRFLEYPGDFSYKTRAIFHRHEYLLMSVFEHEVKVSKFTE